MAFAINLCFHHHQPQFLEIPEKKCLFDLGGFAFEMAKRAPNTAQNTKDTFGTL
jgi:hypothetical protein